MRGMGGCSARAVACSGLCEIGLVCVAVRGAVAWRLVVRAWIGAVGSAGSDGDRPTAPGARMVGRRQCTASDRRWVRVR